MRTSQDKQESGRVRIQKERDKEWEKFAERGGSLLSYDRGKVPGILCRTDFPFCNFSVAVRALEN